LRVGVAVGGAEVGVRVGAGRGVNVLVGCVACGVSVGGMLVGVSVAVTVVGDGAAVGAVVGAIDVVATVVGDGATVTADAVGDGVVFVALVVAAGVRATTNVAVPVGNGRKVAMLASVVGVKVGTSVGAGLLDAASLGCGGRVNARNRLTVPSTPPMIPTHNINAPTNKMI